MKTALLCSMAKLMKMIPRSQVDKAEGPVVRCKAGYARGSHLHLDFSLLMNILQQTSLRH